MNYVIFDLEATCWDKNENRPGASEIIEIGAVKLDSDGNETDRLEQFVKPTHFPKLSEFCTELTSITQDMIDDAPTFTEAIQIFRDWIGYDDDFILCSWGDWDKHQLKNEAKTHGIQNGWFEKHVNIKKQYAKIKFLRKSLGMKAALKKEKISLEGNHHRGIDDALNIAKIFRRYFDFWKIESVRK